MHRSWQSRLAHASTSIAPGNPCCLRSYVPSTRGGGLSSRQYILGCIVIPVVEGPTAGASPLANPERKAPENVVAVRASLAAREVPVDDPEFPPVPAGLVGQHLAEGEHSDTAHPACPLPAVHHCANAQILDAGAIEASYETGRELGHEILTAVGDVGMQAGNPGPLALQAAATFLPASQSALEPRCNFHVDLRTNPRSLRICKCLCLDVLQTIFCNHRCVPQVT